MIKARANHALATVGKDQIVAGGMLGYACGGDDSAELLDSETNRWCPAAI